MTKCGMVYLKIEKRKMKIINTHFCVLSFRKKIVYLHSLWK